MNIIEIKHIAFSSYVEICGIIGLVSGVLYGIFGSIFGMPVSIGIGHEFVSIILLHLIGVPIMYCFGGIITGVITYIPYKAFMKLRKGTVITYTPK